MSELIEPLLGTIKDVKARIDADPPERGWLEAQTRASLIDPVLCALGWDVANPAHVRHEHKNHPEDGRADYSLLKEDGKPAAVVEAKPLHEPLEKAVTQTVTYANEQGARHAALTDGDRWVLYNVFEEAPIRDRKLLDTSLSKCEPHAVAITLLALWRPNSVSGDWKSSPSPMRLEPDPPKPVTPDVPAGWYSLTNPDLLDSRNRPTYIRFPGQSEKKIRYWKDILIQTAVWLFRDRVLTERNLPVKKPGWHVPLIEKPDTKRDETRWTRIPGYTGFRIYTNLKRQDVVECTEFLARHCRKNAADILVQRH